MKKVNIRLTKKIVIPVVAVVFILVGVFGVKSVIYNNKKATSKALATEAYKALEGDGACKVIMKIDGEDLKYGDLICSVKLGDAYSNGKVSYNEKEKIKNSFIDKFLNIAQYSEVEKMMKDEKDFKVDSDEEIKARMKGDLESQSKSSDAAIAGVAEEKLKHIDDDFECYKKNCIVTQWLNRKNGSSMKDKNMTEKEAKAVNAVQNEEIKKLINAAIDNSTIEYVDQSYNYLTKDLIPKP